LQTIWKELPQEHMSKAVANFTKHVTACVAVSGGHFEHLQNSVREENNRNTEKWGGGEVSRLKQQNFVTFS